MKVKMTFEKNYYCQHSYSNEHNARSKLISKLCTWKLKEKIAVGINE